MLRFSTAEFFDGKINLVGTLGDSKLIISSNFQKRRGKPKKKTEIFMQYQFLTKSVLFFWYNSKNTWNYTKL